MRVLAFPESLVPEPVIGVETLPRAHRVNNPYEYGERRGWRPLQRRRFGVGRGPNRPLPTRIAAVVLACLPDLTGFTPTPVIAWDSVSDADLGGYVVYYTPDLAQTFQPIADIPCFNVLDEDTGVESKVCPTSYAVQKALDLELAAANFCVRAYDTADNLSEQCSNIVSLCMPEIWQQGEQYSERKEHVRVVRGKA